MISMLKAMTENTESENGQRERQKLKAAYVRTFDVTAPELKRGNALPRNARYSVLSEIQGGTV